MLRKTLVIIAATFISGAVWGAGGTVTERWSRFFGQLNPIL